MQTMMCILELMLRMKLIALRVVLKNINKELKHKSSIVINDDLNILIGATAMGLIE